MAEAWLGIPIFGSDFWDPNWKQNSNSIFNPGNSGRFIFEFLCWKIDKSEFCFRNSKLQKKLLVGTQYFSFCTRKQSQNGCCHLYIYSKWLPPYLHLLKTVAAIPTFTQNSCHHTYIFSKRLPPYLHLFKMVANIPTSTRNGCRHTYIYSKRLQPYIYIYSKQVDVIMVDQKAGMFSDSWNWKNWWRERIPNWQECVTNSWEHIIWSEKIKFWWKFPSSKGPKLK